MEMFKMVDLKVSLDSGMVINVSKYRADQAAGSTEKYLNRKKKHHIVNQNTFYFARKFPKSTCLQTIFCINR